MAWRIFIVAMLGAALFFGAASCSCGDDDDDDKADPNKPLPDDDTGDDDDSAADDDVDDDTGDDDTSDGVMPHFLGVWDVTGTDDELGAYEGQVEFWVNENGEFRFSRSVRYADQTFDGYDVYSGWDGTAETADNAAEATVTLRRVDYIRAFGDLVRGEDEKTPEVVTGTFAMGEGKTLTLTAGYTSAPAGLVSASETLTYAGENGDLPIFFMDDTYYPTHEPMPDWLHDLVFLIMTDYHALPFFDDYRDREEFDVGVHYYPHFRTDFDWYRAHPETLRVPNKIIDDISLAETRQRSRAYGTLLHEKAEAFDDETAAKNVNDYGLLDQWLAGSEPPERTHDHDSSLWTGTYVASQFYRWRTTGEEEALDNALKSLEGMLTLVPVTGHDPTFARTLRPHEGGTPPPDPGSFTQGAWFQGTAGYEDMDWRCCGNNDMYQGVVYSYVLALRFLPDDAEYDTYRDRIAENIVTLLENNADAQDGQFNEVNANGIAYLATGDGQYLTNYDTLFSPLLEAFVLAGNGLFYLWGITDWSGQHLETVTMLTLQHLVQELKDEGRRGIVKRGWLAGMRNTHTVRYVLWPIAAYSFGDPGPGYEDIFAEAMWGMREAVYPKDSLDVDRRVDPAWTASPIPSLFWKFDWMDGGRHQGALRKAVVHARDIVVLLDDESARRGGGPTPWRDSGADYLHAYWMARAYGLLTSND